MGLEDVPTRIVGVGCLLSWGGTCDGDDGGSVVIVDGAPVLLPLVVVVVVVLVEVAVVVRGRCST